MLRVFFRWVNDVAPRTFRERPDCTIKADVSSFALRDGSYGNSACFLVDMAWTYHASCGQVLAFFFCRTSFRVLCGFDSAQFVKTACTTAASRCCGLCSAFLILRFVVCRLRGVLEQFWHRSRLHCALAMFVNVAYFESGIFRKMCKYP